MPEELNDAPQIEGAEESIGAEQFVAETASGEQTAERELQAAIEAIIYVTDEPVTPKQIADALETPVETVQATLDRLVAEYELPGRGLTIRVLAGGYKMGTRPEYHEALKTFAKTLKPALKLSLAALETLAVIAYKQPVTAPEIQEIRGVQGTGVLKTLLDRKLIQTAGRKNVIGKPMLYKTTKDFLLQFGLKDLNELPTLKEFEELRRLALSEPEEPPAEVEGPKSVAEAEDAAEQAMAATVDKDAGLAAEPEPPEQNG
ncbi:MAG: SMC-Scp complex subunit ScpB [Bryobacter sp.]|jgi:segregation and condensation protein B|nr:SMC-Scp complex subunit ScpB [Bryobacter sp.]